MNYKHSFIDWMLKLWGSKMFLLLFVFNLLSNSTVIIWQNNIWAILQIVCISAISATVERVLCGFITNKKIQQITLWLIIAAHLILAIIDAFLIMNFHLIFGQDIVDILAETNPEEAKSFLSTYLSFGTIFAIIVAILTIITITRWASKKLARNLTLTILLFFLSIAGLGIYLFTVYSYAMFRNGMSVPQMHAFTRVGYSFKVLNDRMQQIENLRNVNRRVTAKQTLLESPTVVVIVGESFSVYHSSLYGYDKMTNPLLSKRQKDSSLVVFDDVVTISDHTEGVMCSVFSLKNGNTPFWKAALFPSCFKAAGYHTAMIDNQYFEGKGITFLADKELSTLMFEYRNQHRLGHDYNLLSNIPVMNDPQLVILHLMGQHYTYSDRYPASFRHFSANDYNKSLPENERELIAHYDNATLYNDFVVEKIIQKFENKNCIIVYFSDHGEEVFEIDNYIGHGNAAHRIDMRYQIRVPLMVWMSSQYQTKMPDVAKRIRQSSQKPIFTDDIAHFLLEIAGIECANFCAEKSFISNYYHPKRKVLYSIDYDKVTFSKHYKPRY